MTDRGIIEITPTVAETDQLQKDLKILREAGAPDNTQAVLDAVRVAARLAENGERRPG